MSISRCEVRVFVYFRSRVDDVLNGCGQGEAKQDWRAPDRCVIHEEVATFTSFISKIANACSGQAGKERVDVYPKWVILSSFSSQLSQNRANVMISLLDKVYCSKIIYLQLYVSIRFIPRKGNMW